MPTYHVKTIANPPPTGIGVSCRLLSFGILTICLFKATLIIKYVNIKEQTPSKMINNVVVKSDMDLLKQFARFIE